MSALTRLARMAMILSTLAGALSLVGCFPPEEFRGANGNAYRRARWQNEHVYRHEDGRWHARRNGLWVVVDGVNIE